MHNSHPFARRNVFPFTRHLCHCNDSQSRGPHTSVMLSTFGEGTDVLSLRTARHPSKRSTSHIGRASTCLEAIAQASKQTQQKSYRQGRQGRQGKHMSCTMVARHPSKRSTSHIGRAGRASTCLEAIAQWLPGIQANAAKVM